MLRLALALVLFAGLTLPAPAWNNAGDIAIADLAWDRLEAGERQVLLELLKHHPPWERYFLAAGKPPMVVENDFLFTLGSTWPDWLRGFAKAKDDEGKKIYLF